MLIKFQTSDHVEVQVEKDDIILSELIKTIMESVDENEEEVDIPLPIVPQTTLMKIVEFTKHYRTNPMRSIPRPLPSDNLREVLDPWYVDYISSVPPGEDLNLLLRCANYMDIEPLQDLGCAQIACFLKGKTPTEIRSILNLDMSTTAS